MEDVAVFVARGDETLHGAGSAASEGAGGQGGAWGEEGKAVGPEQFNLRWSA